MKRNRLFALLMMIAVFIFAAGMTPAADTNDEDTDTRIVEAEVVEITATRISVIARSGVEHVIALDDTHTKITADGETVNIKDVREGDVVTIELDAESPLKLAKNIQVAGTQVARAPRN